MNKKFWVYKLKKYCTEAFTLFIRKCAFTVTWDGTIWFVPLLEFHLLGGSSVGHAEVLAGSSVGVFQFLPSPEAMNDLNTNEVNTSSSAYISHGASGNSLFIFPICNLPSTSTVLHRKWVSKLIAFGHIYYLHLKLLLWNPQ